MVQKGYGWMLKAASQTHQEEVFNYVISKKATMPRTSLRYAIEKMPQELKAKGNGKIVFSVSYFCITNFNCNEINTFSDSCYSGSCHYYIPRTGLQDTILPPGQK